MARNSYFVIKSVSLSANGTGDITIQTDANETLYIHKIAFNSTGAFEIYDFEDSRGGSYTNATTDNPLPSAFLPILQSNLDIYIDLPEPLVLPPSTVLTISVKDKSGSSNTVYFFAVGVREIK